MKNKLSARIGDGGSPCGRIISASTFKRNFYIYKNSRATMICILQTVCPTTILHFQFSTFNFKKLPLGHNMFFDITNYLHELGTPARRAGLFFNRIILHTKNRAIVMTARYAEILCVNFYRKNQID